MGFSSSLSDIADGGSDISRTIILYWGLFNESIGTVARNVSRESREEKVCK